MRKLTIRLIMALLTFLLGVAATTVWLIKRSSVEDMPHREEASAIFQGEQELRVTRPNDAWQPIFFEEINRRVRRAGLSNLRTIALSGHDFEVRVWSGFGLSALEGFVLKRVDGQWLAVHLNGIHSRLPRSEYQRRLQSPISGWDACWQRLVNAGVLTLPDASAIQCNAGVNDGMSYVVEINANRIYRTYMYDNPNYARCNEARQMIEIVQIIGEEFGLEEFRIRN